jgi:RHS repeat-associated protein
MGRSPAPQPTTKEKKLFTGHERDAETGLDYFGARYYRPQVGRFTTVDPELNVKEALVDPQRWNRYAYAKNNPLKYVDPDGRNPALPFICVIPGPQQPILIVGSILVTAAVVVSTEEGRRGVEEAASGLWNLVTKASDALSSVFQNEERKGGGKPWRKQNEDASAAAQGNYEKAKRDLDSARRVPNKTAEQAQKVRELEAQVKHWQKKAHDLSEEHARKAQK